MLFYTGTSINWEIIMFDKLFVKITVHDWLDEMQFENLLFFLLMITALEHAYLANNLQFCIFLETFCHTINDVCMRFAEELLHWIGCYCYYYKVTRPSVTLHNVHKENKRVKTEHSFPLFLFFKLLLGFGIDFEFGLGLALTNRFWVML